MKNTKKYRLSFTEKAKEIASQMSLKEKVSLMSGNVSLQQMLEVLDAGEAEHYNCTPYDAGGNEKYNIPAMKFCDGPRGVVCGVGKTTCFPVSMCRGATFDTELEEKIGHAIGQEVRGYGGNLFAGVCVNLPYHPGWGRSQETYGEDTFHIGQMGAALAKGVQEEDVIACVKHFAFNQMEISRFKVDVTCDKRTEKEVFLSHFKDVIDAGAAAVMSSYNKFQGRYCGHQNYLLNEVLKKDWDFDGFVMSDFIWGIRDTVEAANAGQDMEMCATNYYGEKLVKACQDGFVPEEKIDEAAVRIIRTLLAFEESYQKSGHHYSMDDVGTQEHINLALQCAREGITLLKNENQVLPLDRKKVKKLALIGKLADRENIGDHGSSRVYPAYVVTALQGIRRIAPETEVIYCDGTDIDTAVHAASQADAAVIVAGYNHDDEGEYISENENENYTGSSGGDRKDSLGLHEDEITLIKKVSCANNQTTVVMIGGNTIMVNGWDNLVSGILMAYYPGMEGGTALAEILFGDINPGGKLPFVIPEREEDLPYVNWDTENQYYEYYHGFERLDKNGAKPRFPYGFGLSYTTFEIGVPYAEVRDGELIVKCEVENTGKRTGAEVVQMYVGYPDSQTDRPVKQLKGFSRVTVQPGEKKAVTITCPLEKLKWYNPVSGQFELESMEYKISVGNAADENMLKSVNVQIG